MPPTKRLSLVVKLPFYTLTVIVDILQVVFDLTLAAGVIINRMIDIIMAIVLFFSFVFLGIMNTRTAFYLVISIIIEGVPFLDIAPAWTIDVWRTFSIADAEDKAKIDLFNQQQIEEKILEEGAVDTDNIVPFKPKSPIIEDIDQKAV